MTGDRLGRRQALALGAAGLGAAGVGCLESVSDLGSSTAGGWDWPRVGGSIGNTRRTSQATPRIDWLAPVERWDVGGSPTAVASGSVAVLAGDALVALDAEFGTRWSIPAADHPGWQTVALGGGRCYGLRTDGLLRAFDAAMGEQLWDRDLGDHDAELFPTSEALYVDPGPAPGDPDADAVLALDPSTGVTRWSRRVGEHHRAVALDGDRCYLLLSDGRLAALDREDGRRRWTETPFGNTANYGDYLTVCDDVVFVVDHGPSGGRFGGVDAVSGEVLWLRSGRRVGPVTVARDRPVTTHSLSLADVHPRTGELRRLQYDYGEVHPPVASANALFGVQERVRAARRPSGSWVDGPEFAADTGSPAVLEEGLLVPLEDGHVVLVSAAPALEAAVGGEPVPTDGRTVLVDRSEGLGVAPESIAVAPGTPVRFAWAGSPGSVSIVDGPRLGGWLSRAVRRRRSEPLTEFAFHAPGRYEYEVRSAGDAARGVVRVTPTGGVPRFTVRTTGLGRDAVLSPYGLTVQAGTTVAFEWESPDYSLAPVATPPKSDWGGVSETRDAGYVHEHTFDVPGQYRFAFELELDALSRESRGVLTVLDEDGRRPFDGTIRVGDQRFGSTRSFVPKTVAVPVGTTIRFEWASDDHGLHVVEAPPAVDWEGVPEPRTEGHVHERTLDVPGRYVLTTDDRLDPQATITVRERRLPFRGPLPWRG